MIVIGSYRSKSVESYRGYLLYNYPDFGVIIVWARTKEEVDTSPTIETAKALIDTWLNAP